MLKQVFMIQSLIYSTYKTKYERKTMNKKLTAKKLVIVSLIALCAYTVWFGTIKNPVDYTISKLATILTCEQVL